MSESDGKGDRPYLSLTQANMLMRCGVQYEYRYVKGIKKPPAAAMIRGRGVHKAREVSLTAKIETGDLMSVADVVDVAATEVEAGFAEEVLLGAEEKEEGEAKVKGRVKDEAIALSKLDVTRIQPSINPIDVEVTLRAELKGFGTDLLGVIDVRDRLPSGGVRIRDAKATSRTPNKGSEHDDLQLSLYGLLHRAESGSWPDDFTLDFLVAIKTPKEDVRITTRDAADYAVAVARFSQVTRVIETGILTPAPVDSWWCGPKFCGYWDECPYGGKGRRKPRS